MTNILLDILLIEFVILITVLIGIVACFIIGLIIEYCKEKIRERRYRNDK